MTHLVTRRQFILRGTLVIAGSTLAGATRGSRLLAAEAVAGNRTVSPVLRFGVVTDIHYADKIAAGTRVYRDSLSKMKVAVEALNKEARKDFTGLSFAVTLGDMVDGARPEMDEASIAAEIGLLKAIDAEWGKVDVDRHYVLGNHCVYTLTKEEFFANTKARPAPYSFDVPFQGVPGGVHFVVLDACFMADGTPYGRRNADWRDTHIPASQVKWLAEDLAKTKNPTIILAHQRLDGSGDFHVKNAAEVRAVLEKSGRVLAVLQGHSHQNFLGNVNGIPYCVLRAMVDDPGPANNAFATVEVFADQSIAVHGNFRQDSYEKLSAPILPKPVLA